MKKKNPKDNKQKKQPKNINTFVPQNMLKNVQNEIPIQCPNEKLNNIEQYVSIATPYQIPQEWDNSKTEKEINAELLNNENDNNNNENLYEDPEHSDFINNLPLTFLNKTKNELKWLRPPDFVLNYNIDKEIRRLYPKKKYTQMREDIKTFYAEEQKKLMKKTKIHNENENDENNNEENNNSNEEENNNEENNKSNEEEEDEELKLENDNKATIYKDFYKFIENPPEIMIINFTSRDETEEEYKHRVEETIKSQQNELNEWKKLKVKPVKPGQSKPIAPIVQRPDEIERIKILTKSPSNIDVKRLIDLKAYKNNLIAKINYDKIVLNSYLSWLSSIFQFILDLDISNCVDNKSIFSSIYPQNNGVPIHNPNGHYVVKLFFMGKARRIDIDDRMPCTIDGEFIFPKCEKINELWPALFTKALMKLNVYKIRHPFYIRKEENIDISYIYALTGYHAEIIESGKNDDEALMKIFVNNLDDECYLKKKKYLLCLNYVKINNEDEDKNEHDVDVNNNEREKSIYYEEKIDYYEKLKKEKEEKKENINENKEHLDTNVNINVSASINNNVMLNNNLKSSIINNNSVINDNNNNNNNINNISMYNKFTSQTSEFWKNFEIIHTKLKKLKTSKFIQFTSLDYKLNVIHNFAYSITDFFYNEDFNMNRLKPLNFSDLKDNLKNTTVVFKQLTQNEKKIYLKERRILKLKQLEIKNKRISELQKSGSNFCIIKIKNNSLNIYKLSSLLPFDDEQILMAKKCILNKWKYPPPSFFDKYFKEFDEILKEKEYVKEHPNEKNSHPLAKVKISSLDWTRLNYLQLIGENNDNNNINNEVIKENENDESKNENNENNNNENNNNNNNEIDNNNCYNKENIIEPIIKKEGGKWIGLEDFKKLFNTFLILHNPFALFSGGYIEADENWGYYKMDYYEPIEDFNVIHLIKKEEENNNENNNNNNNVNINNNDENNNNENENIEKESKTYSAFIVFEPNSDKTLPSRDKIYSYIIFDIIDESHNIIKKDITLNKFYSTYYIENLSAKKDYFIIMKGGIYQFGFFLQLYSEIHKVENLSYKNYLKNYYNYQISNFQIEHPNIENHKFYLLGRILISPNTDEEGNYLNENNGDLKIIFNVKYPLKYIKPFIKIIIVKAENYDNKNDNKENNNNENNNNENNNNENNNNENNENNNNENNNNENNNENNENNENNNNENIKYYFDRNNGKEVFFNEEINLKEGKYYAVLAVDKCQYTLKENNLEVDVIYDNNNYKTELIENIDFYYIEDEYVPNRHNIIFKELIYACDNIETTLHIELENPNNNKKEEENEEKKELNDKIKIILQVYQLKDPQSSEFPLIESKYSHNLRGVLLHTIESINSILIPHITFKGGLLVEDKKKPNQKKNEQEQPPPPQFFPYLLICFIDESIDIQNSIACNKLKWRINVYCNDYLCFVKDTSKEDHEKELKESWEINEPGRKEIAKLSRRRFLLENNVKNGLELNEEEKTFLKTQRKRKTTNNNENEENNNINNKNKKTVVNKNKKNDNNNEEENKNKNKNYSLRIKKYLPFAISHRSDYIKNYLNYTYKDRIIQINTINDQFEKEINNDEITEMKTKKINDMLQNFDNNIKVDMSKTFYGNNNNNNNLNEENNNNNYMNSIQNFYKTDSNFRLKEKKYFDGLMKNRNDLKNEFQIKINCQNNINDILKKYIENNYTVDYMINVYKEGCDVFGKENELVEKLFNLISTKKEDEIKNLMKKLSPKDKNNVIKILEDIEFNQWKINPEIIGKLKDFIK